MRCCVLCGIVMILITFRYISRSAPYPDAPPPPHARLARLKARLHIDIAYKTRSRSHAWSSWVSALTPKEKATKNAFDTERSP